jgi:hypothetical protein
VKVYWDEWERPGESFVGDDDLLRFSGQVDIELDGLLATCAYSSNTAAEAKTTTRQCAPWLSNGFASYFDAGKIE